MTVGFFVPEASLTLSRTVPLLPECGKCGLHKGCLSPKIKPSGKGRKRIMIVGEAPGATEDSQGKPFVGDAGDLLWSTLAKFGVERNDCRITNACICRPPRNKLPPKSVDHCRPNLVNAVTDFDPDAIILLGFPAVRSVMGWLWQGEVGTVLGRWLDWRIPCRRIGAWICPCWHPSYVMRTDYGESRRENDVRKLLWERQLKRAVSLKGKPWDGGLPEERITVEMDDRRAAERIGELAGRGVPLAFDYETDRLKPDHPDAFIACCSVSDGREAVAFPWVGKAVAAMREALRSEVPWIASNLKFEERWTRAKLGIRVRRWCWDTMVAAHVLDNRGKISSIKFQAWVLLGVDFWAKAIEPYLNSGRKGCNVPNRIRECDPAQLLTYCARDSLYEVQVAEKQAAAFGVDLASFR